MNHWMIKTVRSEGDMVGRGNDFRIVRKVLQFDILNSIIIAILGLVFLTSGISKLFTTGYFINILFRYGIFPKILVPYLAISLIILEITVGILLFIPSLRRLAVLLSICLLTIFISLIIFVMIHKIEIPCGCIAFLKGRKMDIGLAVQDSILMIMAGSRLIKKKPIGNRAQKQGLLREKTFYNSIFLTLISICFLSACQGKGWQGSISIKNGIRTVENRRAMGYEKTIRAELSFGGDQPGQYSFNRIGAIEISSDGLIYVLDSGDRKVVIFDTEGRLQRSFGNTGSGPGEFGDAVDMSLDSSCNIYVLDDAHKKIIKFDQFGHYLDSATIVRYTRYIDVMKSDRVLLSGMLPGRYGAFGGIYDLKTRNIIKEFSVPFESPPITSHSSISLEERFQFFKGDQIYLAVPFPYEIRKYKDDGSLIEIIKLQDVRIQPPIIHTINEGRGISIQERGKAGPCLVSSNGNIFNNCRWQIVGSGSEILSRTCLDVFDPQGRFLGSIELPNQQTIIAIDRNNCLYALDEAETTRLVRYRIEDE